MEFLDVTLDQLPAIAKEIITGQSEHRIFLFKAELGAGKTTLIKELCAQLGVDHEMSSPTFSIANEYEGRDEQIVHFDLYRLNSPEEIYDIGLLDYLDSGSYCFIEWPEIAESIFESYPHVEVLITIESADKRSIFVKK